MVAIFEYDEVLIVFICSIKFSTSFAHFLYIVEYHMDILLQNWSYLLILPHDIVNPTITRQLVCLLLCAPKRQHQSNLYRFYIILVFFSFCDYKVGTWGLKKLSLGVKDVLCLWDGQLNFVHIKKWMIFI